MLVFFYGGSWNSGSKADYAFAAQALAAQGFVTVLTLVFVLGNLAVDLAYAWLDPRIRLERAA